MAAHWGTWQADSALASAPGAASDGAPFRLIDFIRIIRARKTLILYVTLLTVVLTLIVLLLLPTLYSASAVVMLDSRKNSIADQSAVLSSLPSDPATVQNQIQILTSRDLASNVIDKLLLWRDPEFNGALNPSLLDVISGVLWRDGAADRQHDAIITAFLKHLTADAQGLSTTFTITFASQDPQKAARIANAIAEAYIADQVHAKSTAGERATDWLSARIQQLSEQAQAAEAAVEKYKTDHNLSEAADGTSLVDQQLVAINTQLVQARADLAQKQATYDRVTALVKAGNGADISQVVTSPLIVQLRTQQADLIRTEAQLSSRYGPLHPRMIDIESQKHNLENKIAQEVKRITTTVANDVAIARTQVKSLEDSLQQTEKQASGQGMVRVDLKSLEANAASTRAMYEAFITRLRETQDQGAIQMSDARIISRALVPVNPSSPQRLLIFTASVPAGFLLGLLMALLAERFRLAPQKARTGQLFRGLSVVARIPDSVRVSHAADQVTDWPTSPFAQAIDGLLAKISPPHGNCGGRVVAVTSAEHGEGKAAIAVGLARAAAQRGLRVVIVDSDLQFPEVARTMGLGPAPRDMLDVLTGASPLSRSMAKDARSNAYVLANTRRARNPAHMLASPAMAQLMAHLRQRCDLVIVVTAPILAAADARYVLPLADAVMMVVRWDGNVRPSVDGAIGALGAMRSPPTGLVLAT